MHILLGVPALICAVYLAVCEVIGTYEFLRGDQGSFNYIVAAGCGIAAMLAMMPAFASFAWRGRKGLSVALWALFAVSLVCVVFAAVARTGTATDTAQIARTDSADKIANAKKSETAAEQDVVTAQTALAGARTALTASAADRDCKKECSDLLKSNVDSAQRELRDVRSRLDSARSTINYTEPEKKDPLTRRIAALFPAGAVSEESVRIYQPIAVPVLTSGLSAALMMFAAYCFGPYRERRQAEAKAAATAERIAHALTDEDDEEEIVPLSPLATPPREIEQSKPLALGFIGAGSELAHFALEHIRKDAGAEVSMRDVLQAYEDDCAEHDAEPLDRATFTRELAALCQRTGIKVRVDGKDAYLVGAILAE